MKFMGLNEIREKYLAFFESKGHLRLPSFSLVPQNDNSLLLVNSGMAPLKKFFTGELTPPSKRITTCQKCIRTPDIERVGKTARHGTYFEMLGNFSFGDYFKVEATAWAWEFVTKVMEIPEDKIWVSIYLEDDEAFDIWTKNVGVSADKIVRLGKADNFWEHGTGPCGPCSEIYFDRGEAFGCGSESCAVGCDCDRYVEFWNLVFTQFDSDGNGNYARLANPNIDTGMGLERLACIMQGVNNLFEVDTVANIIKHASDYAKITYGFDSKKDISLRVIADHIRSTTFMVGDGVIPSNEGKGYVLRRLLRRAARHGKLLGIQDTFLFDICNTVIKANKTSYPELFEKQDYIKKVIKNEEESFARTIDQGLSLLSEMVGNLNGDTLSGDDTFKLYDTFGFPIDLTKDILAEQGKSVDEERFNVLMKEQKERARNARVSAGDSAWKGSGEIFAEYDKTEFAGYKALETNSTVLAIFFQDENVGEIFEGQNAIILLDKTPFYAESGGQVGDKGTISNGSATFKVCDCKKTADGKYMHLGKVVSGKIAMNDLVTATVNVKRREAIMRNHSSAHLLQKALREVLGNHIEQAGSYVDDTRMRFDFTHFAALTNEEISKVQEIVNAKILEGLHIEIAEMSIAAAKKMGATALFGEKYGETVRVVNMGSYSIELCGGTHLNNTAKVGLFKIISEASVASGVRRIEAVTGENLLSYLNEKEEIIEKTADALKANNANELASKANSIASELKTLSKTVAELNQRIANIKTESLITSAVKIKDFRVISSKIENSSIDALRVLGDTLKDKDTNVIALLASSEGEKIHFVCVCGKDAVKNGANAGNIVKEAAKLTGGGGGGKPDSATAGGKDITKLNEAMELVFKIV
jgi:alanyl-tRNA synthetase